MPMFVLAVILLIVGSQEKAPVPGKGEERRNDCKLSCHEYTVKKKKIFKIMV